MKKADVKTHSALPAVNVKCHERFGGDYADSIASNPTTERATKWAWETHVEQFWQDAQNDAEFLFGKGVKVYAAGRSGGWLVVEGLPEVEGWNAIMLGKWALFVKAREADRDYLCSAEAVRETIEANEWLDPTPRERIEACVKALGEEQAAKVLESAKEGLAS